ncbi:MAG: proline--tRNA ligase [Parachlamydiales bacterium]
MAQKITPRSTDYSRWYTDIIQHAQLADHSPVRGCMVIRPNGYSIWEKIQAGLDKRFKETGHQNFYCPIFIPQEFITREAKHVEGFAPELAVVTHGGGKELEEPLVVRPTSETMIWHMYKNWISSWRDLPLLYNQWANVVRWEMRTRLFIRTTEFLWQEGHTAHASEEEAIVEATRMLEVYRAFIEEVIGIPLICGRKTEKEKFAGAVETFTMEGLMQDGKALQMGTSHYLGQNFAKAFDVQFQNKQGAMEYVYATSWGTTTRLIGALIMTHSDDQGLVLPPLLAATQIVIVPIWKSDEDKRAIREFVAGLLPTLRKDWQVHFDDREEETPGFKFNEWELKGVPVRLEIGPRDLKNGTMVIARRDTGEKEALPVGQLSERLAWLMQEIQVGLFERARERRDSNTHTIDDYEAFKRQAEEGGFIRGHWCGKTSCEEAIAEETKATIRVIPFDQKEEKGKCLKCGSPSNGRVIFAKAY